MINPVPQSRRVKHTPPPVAPIRDRPSRYGAGARARYDAPTGKDLHNHLGKSTAHHQVVPATTSTTAGHTANRPHVLVRNAHLSSTGGLRGASTHHTHSGQGKTLALSHHDRRRLLKRGGYSHQPSVSAKGK